MAEERLIDDDLDKNKKYKFRINENGKEELVIEDSGEESEGDDVSAYNVFEVAEEDEDDEEAAVMTPEQLAIKREREAAEAEKRAAYVAECVRNAREDIDGGKFATALEYLEKAAETDPERAEVYYLNMSAYTKKFTDFTKIEKAAESAESFSRYSKGEFLEEAQPAFPLLKERIAALKAEVEEKSAANDKAKSVRAERFNRDRRTAIIFISVCAVLFAALLTCAIVFANKIMSVAGGSKTYTILTCVFGALAFVCVIFFIVAARKLYAALRRVRKNKRDSATAAGRALIEKRNELDAFIAVYSALNGKNDLS